VEPEMGGSVRLFDAETNETHEIFVDQAVLARYRAGLANHQQNWARACRQLSAMLVTVVAEKFLMDWKLDELVAAEILKVG
jgi:hypothetical protein